MAIVKIDGVTKPTIDLYQPSLTYQVVYSFTGLSAGAHTIELKPAGTKNASSSSKKIVFDAFVAHT